MPLSAWERWRLAGKFSSKPVQLAGETPALPGYRIARRSRQSAIKVKIKTAAA